MTDGPVAFSDFKPEQFPFRARLIREEDGEVVFEQIVHGPGALRIPGQSERGDHRPVTAELTFASGQQVQCNSDGVETFHQVQPLRV